MFLTDRSVSLDQILIQLKEVAPKWRELAEAVGAENVNEISDFVRKILQNNNVNTRDYITKLCKIYIVYLICPCTFTLMLCVCVCAWCVLGKQ